MIDESLIIRYFGNQLEPELKKEVELWMESDEENKTLAKDIYKIYVATEVQNLRLRTDAEHVRHALDKRITAAERGKRKMVWTWIQRVAAILFIPLAIGYTVQILKEDQVSYVETRATPGMICSVDLPDGSKVWLNSDSHISYPTSFKGKTRSVKLDGEAYFSVQKSSKPFVVETDGVEVEVLGTEFNIDAYECNGFISTTLVEGLVNLKYNGVGNHQHSFIMNPNQKTVYFKSDKHLIQKETYVPNDIAWRDGRIILRDTPLKDVLWILSKRFNVDFDVKKPEFNDYSFTGVFNDQQLKEILVHFNVASKINYRIEVPETADSNNLKRTKITLY